MVQAKFPKSSFGNFFFFCRKRLKLTKTILTEFFYTCSVSFNQRNDVSKIQYCTHAPSSSSRPRSEEHPAVRPKVRPFFFFCKQPSRAFDDPADPAVHAKSRETKSRRFMPRSFSQDRRADCFPRGVRSVVRRTRTGNERRDEPEKNYSPGPAGGRATPHGQSPRGTGNGLSS